MPDLVLLDYQLGADDPDGLECLRRLRARVRSLAIVLVSAYLSEDRRDAALAAGAQECWAKPLSLQQLQDGTTRILTTIAAV